MDRIAESKSKMVVEICQRNRRDVTRWKNTWNWTGTLIEKIGGVDVLINPMLVIEVLSKSTMAYDRVDKFTAYKSIPSLGEYLLVEQHRPHVTQFIKRDDGEWIHREYNDLNDVVKLESVGREFSLSEVYQGVSFKPIGLPLEPPQDLG